MKSIVPAKTQKERNDDERTLDELSESHRMGEWGEECEGGRKFLVYSARLFEQAKRETSFETLRQL
jgi:hypothetical protein